MAHAGNTNICRIWAKIISTYAKKCSISVEGRRGEERGGEGRGQKTKVYDLSGHECIRQCSDDGKALKYCAQYPGVMQESQEGKRANLWCPRAHFGANIPMKITRHWNTPNTVAGVAAKTRNVVVIGCFLLRKPDHSCSS